MSTREMAVNAFRTTEGALPARSKRCPRCGELLFDDMDVCYGCLYDFTREPYRLPEGMIDEVAAPPEVPTDDEVPEVPEPASGAPCVRQTIDSANVTARKVLLSTDELCLAIPLPARGLTVGRASDNDVVLRAAGVADHHLLLMPRQDDVVALGLVSRAFAASGAMANKDCAFLRTGESVSLFGLNLGIGMLST